MNKSDKNNHMDVLKSCLDLHSANYRNLITIGHLNTETDQECIKLFSEFFSESHNLSCLNSYYQASELSKFVTRLSDFHRMRKELLKYQNEKSRTIGTIRSFVMIDFENISYLHYQLKTLRVTATDLKIFTRVY